MYDIDRLKKHKNFKEGQYWASPLNALPEINQNLNGKTIRIHDVTLRDGEQTSNMAFSMAERVRIAEALDDLGVASIEAGMPIISEEVRKGIKKMVDLNLTSEVIGFCRTNRTDVDLAEECGVKSIIVEHVINPYLIEQVYGIDPEQVVENVVAVISYAKSKGLKVSFMGWDLSRADDMDCLENMYKQICFLSSPSSVILVDTLGCALPRAAGYLVKQVKSWLPGVTIEYHNHNEFGIANAGALEAVAAGAEVLHTSINGLGERTGNAATEEIVMMLEVLAGVTTGVNTEKLMETSLLLENLTNLPVPHNKPVVGRGLFDVEQGVGIDIMRKMSANGFTAADVTLTPYTAEMVGQEPGKPVIGKNSGRSTTKYFLEKYGLVANEDQISEITDKLKYEGRLQKRLLTEQQFIRICERVL